MVSVWPAEALRRGVDGAATIKCSVTSEGLLTDCQVVRDEPAGAGFGGAALLLSKLFAMRPHTQDGVSVAGATVILPMRFQGPGEPGPEEDTAQILNVAVWSQAPSAAELAAVFPTGQISKSAYGFAVIRCRVYSDGALGQCMVQSQQPTGKGFGDAAYRLISKFKIDTPMYPPGAIASTYVSVPVFMRPPGSPPITIANPIWRREFDPASTATIFPAKALAAQVKRGGATLDCAVNQYGRLNQCAAISESPAGLGFGDAAIKASQAMAMSAWTDKGEPVDGARVKVTIDLDLSPQPAAP